VDVFDLHGRLISDYDAFTSSLVRVRDEQIARHLAHERERGVRWPDPWLSLNPSFESGGTISELVRDGLLHPECERQTAAAPIGLGQAALRVVAQRFLNDHSHPAIGA
jgi:hypothetical protein